MQVDLYLDHKMLCILIVIFFKNKCIKTVIIHYQWRHSFTQSKRDTKIQTHRQRNR